MLSSSKPMAFLAVRQIERARSFYRDTLGLQMVADELPFALVFDIGGILCRVTPIRDWTPPKHTVLGWQVPDIAEAVRELMKSGVVFERFGEVMQQDELGIWTAPNGARVAWFKDPDGNVLSVSQH